MEANDSHTFAIQRGNSDYTSASYPRRPRVGSSRTARDGIECATEYDLDGHAPDKLFQELVSWASASPIHYSDQHISVMRRELKEASAVLAVLLC